LNAATETLSSYLAIKGPFIETTFRAFSDWDFSQTPKENFEQIEATNNVGASSDGWLKQFIRVLRQRYDLAGVDRPLIELVQQGWHIEDWRPVQLWHISRKDELLREFLANWAFERREQGIVVLTVDSVVEYLHTLVKERLGSVDSWKDNTYRRVASGLLKTATEFSLLRGHHNKEFEAYRLPERSLMYLLHALMERENNTRKVIAAEDWRLFLMKPNEVEEELLRLHQYGKLQFERAGSFLELTLPCENTDEYVRSVTL
jgi:hypothetical protein